MLRSRAPPALLRRRAVKALDADWQRLMRVQVVESLIREAARILEKRGLRYSDLWNLQRK